MPFPAPVPHAAAHTAANAAAGEIRQALVRALGVLATLPPAEIPGPLCVPLNVLLQDLSVEPGYADSGNFEATVEEIADPQVLRAIARILAFRRAVYDAGRSAHCATPVSPPNGLS